MTNDREKATEIEDGQLDDVQGGAETVHLYLQSNGEDIKGETTEARKAREIVVVGSKVKDVVRNP